MANVKVKPTFSEPWTTTAAPTAVVAMPSSEIALRGSLERSASRGAMIAVAAHA